MSITVRDVLNLPSLRRARVVAGEAGLDKIITTISVLEYAYPDTVQKDLLSHISFNGSEMVITAFANIAEDVDAQCANLQMLSNAGEVGVILYYVGYLMPRVDQRLIDLADELSLPLIVMPENELSLRYSEVISEVMDAVIRDQIGSTTFALDLIEQISQTASHNRTMDNVLRIVCDQLRVNMIVADSNHDILNQVTWPRNQRIPTEDWIQRVETNREEQPILVSETPRVWGYRKEIHFAHARKILLFAFSEGHRLEPAMWKQAIDGIKISINLWSESHDYIDLSELLKAILQDEPIKMRRLGKIYNIDVAALGDAWILHNLDGSDIVSHIPQLKELSRQYVHMDICEPYEGNVVLLPIGLHSLQTSNEWADALVGFCREKKIPAVLTRCTSLKTAGEVREAYLDNQLYIQDAMTIFPSHRHFTLQEVEFAKQCRLIAEGGELAVHGLLELVQPMRAWRDGVDVIETLSVYLLDKNSSITETAATLFVHKNTIKYRLQKASDCLGFRIGEFPQSQKLMICLAVRRLSNKPL